MAYDYDRSDRVLRKANNRLTHDNPDLRPHLLPLVRQASRKLDPYVMEALQLIHKNRQVRHTWEVDVSKAYTTLQNAGEGYSVGEEGDDISSIPEAGRFIDTVDHGQVAVYWNSRHLTLVADVYGPWAVDIKI